jgi:cytochrome c biogenesis protein CcdA
LSVSDLHTWIVFLHIAGVLIFLLAHGVSAGVMLRLRSERDPGAVRTLVDFSRRSMIWMSVGALIWLVAGIAAGFTGRGGAGWWTTGTYWIWASLAIAIAIIIVMTPWGRMYLNRVRAAVGVDPKTGAVDPSFQVDQASLDAAIASGKPELLATIGVGGVIVLAWLMIFKPF